MLSRLDLLKIPPKTTTVKVLRPLRIFRIFLPKKLFIYAGNHCQWYAKKRTVLMKDANRRQQPSSLDRSTPPGLRMQITIATNEGLGSFDMDSQVPKKMGTIILGGDEPAWGYGLWIELIILLNFHQGLIKAVFFWTSRTFSAETGVQRINFVHRNSWRVERCLCWKQDEDLSHWDPVVLSKLWLRWFFLDH